MASSSDSHGSYEFMMDPLETFGPLDRPALIGLTGLRGAGKTSAAQHLVDRYGFERVHAFGGGKEMCKTLFVRHGADPVIASRMVNGDLRDEPADILPDRATPRLFMERLGRFMGVDMGPKWTLGAEITRAWRRHPGCPLVVESVVYEADVIRAHGGTILRVIRPGHTGPAGVETDAAQAAIDVDGVIVNDGDLAALCDRIGRVAQAATGGR